MYLSVEFLDHDPCVLRRELIGFSLKEGDDWSGETSGSDFNSTLGISAERKILFQHDTVLDRHMVSVNGSYHTGIFNNLCLILIVFCVIEIATSPHRRC